MYADFGGLPFRPHFPTSVIPLGKHGGIVSVKIMLLVESLLRSPFLS